MFDIAIVWDLPRGQTKNALLQGLLQQNNCSELIVLKEEKAFWDLPIYTRDSITKLGTAGIVRELVLRRGMKEPTVFALCMAATLYPEKFELEPMIAFLRKRFLTVQKMQAKGRANVVTAALQTHPRILQRMLGNTYRWTNELDHEIAAAELTALLKENEFQAPTKDDLKGLRE